MTTCVVIGGGVVGLSLAYELAHRDWQVTLLDQARTGSEASWAGAGMLPDCNPATALHPLERLRAFSNRLHAEWAAALQRETGIDNGYRRCGGIYVARTAGEAASLAGWADTLREEAIPFERCNLAEIARYEPRWAESIRHLLLRAMYRVPGDAQLRNPRHLQALKVACALRGVRIVETQAVQKFVTRPSEIEAVVTAQGESFAADTFAVTSGAWTPALLNTLGLEIGILPIRGQMVLFKCERPPLRHFLNEGSRYVVPREDGHVLAGSTEEEAGFDKSTTPEAIAELVRFAREWVPELAAASVEASWSGLRPASYDGLPYIGRLPGFANAFIAAGHFRSGLQLSPGTALALADLLESKSPLVDLSHFRVGR